MMMTIVEALWLRLHAILSVFAEKLAAVDPALVRDLGRTANDAFVLRGFLAFRRSADGEEVAITVDIQNDGQHMTVTSDVCKDDGRVVVAGPSAAIRLSEPERSVEIAINDWLHEFDQFLLKHESEVVAAVSRLA
jgi:hypothetical protein